MRKIKATALVVAAVLAVGCVALSSTAQATLPAPEWQVKGGKLTKNIPFIVKGGFGKLEVGKIVLTWTGATGEGELEAPGKIAKLFLKFTGSSIGGCQVKSPGAKEAGVVNTKQLKGVLGYVNETEPTVGVLIEAVEGASGTVLEVEKSACDPVLTVITGGTIGKYSPIDKLTEVSEAAFLIAKQILKFEGEATEHLLELNGSSSTTVLFECIETIGFKEKIAVEVRT
jgi:hypothetical protein